MKHLDELNFLIDAASKIAGNDSRLAAMLGVPRQHVSMWRKGAKACQPEDQALLASVAGFDPQETLIRATVQYWEGKPKGDRLMRVLGKLSRATGAALGFVGASALAIYSMSPTPANAKAVEGAREHNVHNRNRSYVKRRLAHR